MDCIIYNALHFLVINAHTNIGDVSRVDCTFAIADHTCPQQEHWMVPYYVSNAVLFALSILFGTILVSWYILQQLVSLSDGLQAMRAAQTCPILCCREMYVIDATHLHISTEYHCVICLILSSLRYQYCLKQF